VSQRFTVDGEINIQYRHFNATGTQLSVRILPPPPDSNPLTHFLDSMFDLFEYALRNYNEFDMVGVRINNEVNPYPTAFPYGNGIVLHFYQQQESSTTKTVHKVINKGLKTYV
jgi:hypothetical protein